jgi:hypothetical protein
MLLLDDTSRSALAIDPRPTPSAAPLAAALTTAWPRLAGRVTTEARAIADVELGPADVAARARLALLPCCQDDETCDAGGLKGWMDLALAVDATRVARLRAEGYAVTTQTGRRSKRRAGCGNLTAVAGNVVNLNRFRKKRLREEKAKQADGPGTAARRRRGIARTPTANGQRGCSTGSGSKERKKRSRATYTPNRTSRRTSVRDASTVVGNRGVGIWVGESGMRRCLTDEMKTVAARRLRPLGARSRRRS